LNFAELTEASDADIFAFCHVTGDCIDDDFNRMGSFFLAVVEVWHQRLDELGLIHEFPFCISVGVKTPTLSAKIRT
jgi:hypothetical protein